MHTSTFVEIDLDILSNNIKNIISKYNDYKYYIAMIKSNAYSHGYYIVNTLIESGINYLAVSSLDEALEIREYNKDIPVLVTEIIEPKYIDEAIKSNITLTVDSLEYLENLKKHKCTIHIKIDSGMNRLGVKTKSEFNKMIEYINSNKNIYLEGIFTHFATPGINDIYYDKQLSSFRDITSDIDLKSIPIVHLSSSFIVLSHPRIEEENAIRFGTMMYGYDISLKSYASDIKGKLRSLRDNYLIKKNHISPVIRNVKIDLKPCLKLKTNVMEIKTVKKGEIIGYGSHIVNENTKVAILSIGYDSGIGSETMNRYVLINNHKYPVIGPICMCMMLVKVDNNVKVGDEVIVLGNELTLGYMSRLNSKSIQETLVNLGTMLPRVYIKNKKVVKTIIRR